MTQANRTRKRLTAKEKVQIIHEHLVGRVPVSDLCERYGITPKQYYK